MKRHILYFMILPLLSLLIHDYALADGTALYPSNMLAVVPVKNGNIDSKVYSQFDSLVPKLKKISRNKVIKLECRYSGRSDNEQDVQNAYLLAARIEKYFRIRHKLDLDLWVAIDMMTKTEKTPPMLTIGVFADSPKNLDTMQVNTIKN